MKCLGPVISYDSYDTINFIFINDFRLYQSVKVVHQIRHNQMIPMLRLIASLIMLERKNALLNVQMVGSFLEEIRKVGFVKINDS